MKISLYTKFLIISTFILLSTLVFVWNKSESVLTHHLNNQVNQRLTESNINIQNKINNKFNDFYNSFQLQIPLLTSKKQVLDSQFKNKEIIAFEIFENPSNPIIPKSSIYNLEYINSHNFNELSLKKYLRSHIIDFKDINSNKFVINTFKNDSNQINLLIYTFQFYELSLKKYLYANIIIDLDLFFLNINQNYEYNTLVLDNNFKLLWSSQLNSENLNSENYINIIKNEFYKNKNNLIVSSYKDENQNFDIRYSLINDKNNFFIISKISNQSIFSLINEIKYNLVNIYGLSFLILFILFSLIGFINIDKNNKILSNINNFINFKKFEKQNHFSVFDDEFDHILTKFEILVKNILYNFKVEKIKQVFSNISDVEKMNLINYNFNKTFNSTYINIHFNNFKLNELENKDLLKHLTTIIINNQGQIYECNLLEINCGWGLYTDDDSVKFKALNAMFEIKLYLTHLISNHETLKKTPDVFFNIYITYGETITSINEFITLSDLFISGDVLSENKKTSYRINYLSIKHNSLRNKIYVQKEIRDFSVDLFKFIQINLEKLEVIEILNKENKQNYRNNIHNSMVFTLENKISEFKNVS